MDNKADNESQSQIKRLTTHNSPKLLTRQLGSVVRQKSDNQNQQITAQEVGFAEGKAEGKAEGRAEGIAEGKAETARKMLADGLDISKISQYTGLSPEQIRAL